MINSFLELFSKTIAKGEHAVMIWDGAGFHTSKSLKVPENVSLIQLPAYSPELNPIENLWHYLKSHFWSNRAYDDYQALENAGCKLGRWSCLTKKLSSLSAPRPTSIALFQIRTRITYQQYPPRLKIPRFQLLARGFVRLHLCLVSTI